MTITLFTISTLLFLITFGINMFITNPILCIADPFYNNSLWTVIDVISGFVLSPTSTSLAFHLNWFIAFFINIAMIFFIGGKLTKAYLVRFASGIGLERDIKWTAVMGIVIFVSGLIIR